MKKCLPLCLLFLLLLGCASSSEVADVRRDVTTVYREFRSYRDSTDARLSKLESDVSALSQSVRSVEELTRKQFLDLSMSLEGKDEKIKTILGKLDELDSQLRTYWGETKGELRELKGGRSTGTPHLKDPEKAIVSFQEVIDKHPDSEKAPRALLRQAEAFAQLGDKKSSATLLRRVAELYPKSDEARIAERLLRNLGAQ